MNSKDYALNSFEDKIVYPLVNGIGEEALETELKILGQKKYLTCVCYTTKKLEREFKRMI